VTFPTGHWQSHRVSHTSAAKRATQIHHFGRFAIIECHGTRLVPSKHPSAVRLPVDRANRINGPGRFGANTRASRQPRIIVQISGPWSVPSHLHTPPSKIPDRRAFHGSPLSRVLIRFQTRSGGTPVGRREQTSNERHLGISQKCGGWTQGFITEGAGLRASQGTLAGAP